MSESVMPSYRSCEAAFEHFDALGTPADAHGLLCALLCAGATMHSKAWVDALLTKPINSTKDQAHLDILKAFYEVTVQQSEVQEPGIEPLICDQEEPLESQLEALSSWAQGFVTGLGLVGVNVDPSSHSDEAVKEALDDLVQISLLSSDVGGNEDAGERRESFEVLRVHAQLCMNMLKASKAKLGVRITEQKSGTLH